MPAAEAPPRPLLTLVLAEGALALPALAIAWWFALPLGEQFPGGWQLAAAVARGVVATLPMLAVLAVLVRSDLPSLTRFRQAVERMLDELVGGTGLGWLIAVSLAAGFSEELLFRGVLQPLLAGWLGGLGIGPWAGVAVASLLFGLAHPISRLYVALATVIGLYLGSVVLLSGEVVSAMVAHAVYDFVALVWLLRRRG